MPVSARNLKKRECGSILNIVSCVLYFVKVYLKEPNPKPQTGSLRKISTASFAKYTLIASEVSCLPPIKPISVEVFPKTDIKISLGEPITMSKIDPTMIGTELLKYS